MSEIDLRPQRLADALMGGKLLAIVGRNGMGVFLLGSSRSMGVGATSSACLVLTLPMTV